MKPLQEKLNELELQIKDLQQKINTAKSGVVRNDEGIAKMLALVVNH